MSTDSVRTLIEALLNVDEDDASQAAMEALLLREHEVTEALLAVEPTDEQQRYAVDEVLSRLPWDPRILARMEARFPMDGELFVRHTWRLPDDQVVAAMIGGLVRAVKTRAPEGTVMDLLSGIADLCVLPAELAELVVQRFPQLEPEIRRKQALMLRLAAKTVVTRGPVGEA